MKIEAHVKSPILLVSGELGNQMRSGMQAFQLKQEELLQKARFPHCKEYRALVISS